MTSVALGLATVVTAAACGGSSSGGTPPDTQPTSAGTTSASAPGGTEPANPTAARKEITTTWETFFHTGTSRADAVQLLEDGDQLGGALDVAEQEDKDTGLVRRAKVSHITFTSATNAAVTWVLYNRKEPLLSKASGTAVFVAGKWQVSKVTFCTLVKLGANGKDVPGCL